MPGGRNRRGRGSPPPHSDVPHPRVELVPDDAGGVTLMLDGSPQSHVQPQDPGLLVFEYVSHLALVLGTLAPPPPAPLAVTHVGGAAMTLARWVEHTRPGSPQIVLEPDVEVTTLVRRELPLPRRHRIRVRPADGVTGTAALADSSADAVVVDAYAGGRVPAELTTTSYLADAGRVLRPSGVLLLNLADEPGLRYVARVLASLDAAGVFVQVAVLATADVLKSRRFGNVVVAAGRSTLDLPALARAVAGAPHPTGLRHGKDVERMTQSARLFTSADASPSPSPPPLGSWRAR